MEEALIVLLSPLAGGRWHWTREPQDERGRPYGVLSRITGLRDYHMQGASGYVQSRVQIDVYGESYKSSKTTARQAMRVLGGFRGTIGSTYFHAIFIDSERDLPASDAGDVKALYRTSFDIIAHHTE
ncbi:hypothetical protein [Chelativorans oligotrophicus]|uniref:hypothetical protein n=1 Tax=Chelativorans oligotrophicus TaxID=449974 RepID=UPI00140BBF47|nr:hypothetical protein [Chelativorans oligotrophicus]